MQFVHPYFSSAFLKISLCFVVVVGLTAEGLKYYDVVEGKGPIAEKGSTVQVHFDCIYRNITAVSSRESKLLAGNRIIAQPYEFKVGATPGKERKRDFVDNPNGLFSAQAAPKPPPAMYSVTEGMRVGGKRTVIVPPEAGYGQKGMNEIPPGSTFELNIELLQVMPPEENNWRSMAMGKGLSIPVALRFSTLLAFSTECNLRNKVLPWVHSV
ncbi:hypothetical protein CCACVL1_07336 [Corchorus capsularis]|uniref:peptidylprolyl isomerase n=1 Tax=Corchorus capsularis TaxID=210143 RepID=A0A1R3J700_COCAP|nr:hypothetical protein CCACVL1_07336 [Corchorus capsularis]